jgi:hypothetical protein
LASVSGELVPGEPKGLFPGIKGLSREEKTLTDEEKGISPWARGNDPGHESFLRMHIELNPDSEAWRGRKGLWRLAMPPGHRELAFPERE